MLDSSQFCLWVHHDEVSQKLVVDAGAEILFPIVTGRVPGEGELESVCGADGAGGGVVVVEQVSPVIPELGAVVAGGKGDGWRWVGRSSVVGGSEVCGPGQGRG